MAAAGASTQAKDRHQPSLDVSLLSPPVKFQDQFALYLAAQGLVTNPVEVAFAAVYVAEACGLQLIARERAGSG